MSDHARIDDREFSEVFSRIRHMTISPDTHTEINNPKVALKRTGYSTTTNLASDRNDDVFLDRPQSGKMQRGISDWSHWRTQLNDDLIDIMDKRHIIFGHPNSFKHLQHHKGVLKDLTEPTFTIDKSLSNFVLDLAMNESIRSSKPTPSLSDEAFLSFGIPRVKIRFNKTFTEEPIDTNLSSPDSGCSLGSPLDSSDQPRRLRRFDISEDDLKILRASGNNK